MMITLDLFDIICLLIMIIFLFTVASLILVWHIENKLSNIMINLPNIKIGKPEILLQVTEDTKNNKIVLAAKNGSSACDDYYEIKYLQ